MPTLTSLKSSRLAPFSIKKMATSLSSFITANMTGVDPSWNIMLKQIYMYKENIYI